MDQGDIQRKLEALKPKTNAGKLRPLMPVIEAQLAAGVHMADILAVLREGGIEMKAGSFRNFVASYRKQRAAHVSTPTQPSRGSAVASVSYDTGTVPAAAPRTPAVASAKHVPPTPQELVGPAKFRKAK